MQSFPISKNLDHLGLVSGMCDRLNLSSKIDELLPNTNGLHQVSTGTCVKALILNGLGFAERRLYLSPHFFSDKPVAHLLGENLSAEMFNDDRLGRCLDDLYAFGVSELFSHLAAQSYEILGLSEEVDSEFRHLDATSFGLEGQYNSELNEAEVSCLHITQGYSRDHRPDLNQVMLNLVVENSSGIPLLMEGLHGNTSDQTSFGQTIDDYVERLQNNGQPICWVADSALYTEETIGKISGRHYWITRVPSKLTAVQELLLQVQPEHMQFFTEEKLKNYRYQKVCNSYGGVRQEWMVVFSEAGYKRDVHSLKKRYLKKSSEEHQDFIKLCKKVFSCKQDAEKAWEQFSKKCQYLSIEDLNFQQVKGFKKPGKPPKGAQKQTIGYRITGCPLTKLTHYEQLRQKQGKFVIASNDTAQRWGNGHKLLAYKGQSNVEKGFRFLKDKAFLADSFFVKKPERLEAILMIMALSLMVYAALERELRKNLQQEKEFVLDQTKKETQKPTMKWIFEFFRGIHCLWVNQEQPMLILNMNEMHTKVIRLLGQEVRKYYLLE
ncbi:IS1634 family transposase [Microscilla marina]|uniref:Transposase, IS4 family n=2 Tax=Microscilla marina ATCC 23134 TaxID=313606 RepID=A1ZHP0_MICM2|nr:IS1634 family transposase [Microscilla marina]EAY26849.1 transposase, IS4 family [Microscilla marina ATCC 23134]EAY27164.1 transposase, IS4 family [Microscilla marina ATCC 23134]EAY27305.1 transposase, IS4 family [Microscilla marina ATCC 23134]EAY29291.1 transposase, IS4 family [Microscilla marina ATCC 23134]EAY29529.1 transposase, IS4 family [Microscilla marina ATCC 23134]